MLPLGVGWAAFAIVILVVLVFCFFIVRYYTDRHESEALPTVVTIAALTLSLLALFLIPIDILSVSQRANAGDEIRTLYYILYSCILAFAFIIIPFSYFYYEEFDEDVTVKQRIVGGLKYTIFLVVIVVILLVIGIFVFKFDANKIPKEDNIQAWTQFISDQTNRGRGAIAFAVACLAIVGYFIWLTYTAYGLSAFPIGLLKGKRHLAEEASDIQSDLETTREQKRAISSKYMTGKKMNSSDEKKFELLKRQERILAGRSARIEGGQRGFAKVVHVCKPFVFVFGIILSLISLLIVISLVLTLIDKFVNSCGVKCGFFAKYPKIPNPIDLLLWNLAPYFPLDYVVLGSLIAYIFFCTLSGIVRIGVRFLWVHLYNIRPRQTPPQGLLLTSVILMLALLVLNIEIMTLAPAYASFGTQTYLLNGTVTPCSITAPTANCTMTQIGIFVSQIELGTPFFGNVFYYAMWVFVLAFVIGAIITCVRRKASNLDEENESDDDDRM